MKAVDTTEGNDLIAIFSGYDFYPDHYLNHVKGVYKKKGMLPLLAKDLKYHSSWNELMPAVEKASKVYDEDNAPPSKGDVLISNLMMSLQTFNKLEIFNCLVEFIIFRNSNK